ncbi:MAG: LLM class flavin-dependent oxidoreductase [Nitrospinota bacterium]|nr:MAG: LLM class flavin-dependent oxidoreductase [Nitrospinota bacterium]
MEYGLLLFGEHPAEELITLARLAEDEGYDVFWYADEKFYRDVYVGLTAVAMSTSRIRLGTCVTDPYARHPALTAAAVAALDELSHGRMILGIGAGGSGFPTMGIRRERPAVAIREAVEIIRGLWRGERVHYTGSVLFCHNGQLNFPVTRLPPVVIGTRGYHTLKMAGAVADGVMIAPYASAPGLRYAIGRIREGAQGRPHPVQIIARVDICVNDDHPQMARQAVKRMIALPLWNSYPHFQYLEVLGLEVPSALQAQLAKRDYSLIVPSASLVPDSFVRHLAVAGSRQEVITQLQEIAATGVDQITMYPVLTPGQTIQEAIIRFARDIMPQVRR